MAQVVEAPVLKNVQFGPGGCILTVGAPAVAAHARPGQFVMASETQGSGLPSPLLKRAMAIYDLCDSGSGSTLRLLMKVVGPGTAKLAAAQPGSKLDLVGPLGHGFELGQKAGRTNVLVAGGTGIASLLLLARALLAQDERVRLIYGGRSASDLIGLDDFQALGVETIATTEDGSQGVEGIVTDPLLPWLEALDPANTRLFACGPNAMMQAVSALAEKREIDCQISIEAKMGCGFGVCLGCTVKTNGSFRLACTDGPVFRSVDFIWENSGPPPIPPEARCHR